MREVLPNENRAVDSIISVPSAVNLEDDDIARAVRVLPHSGSVSPIYLELLAPSCARSLCNRHFLSSEQTANTERNRRKIPAKDRTASRRYIFDRTTAASLTRGWKRGGGRGRAFDEVPVAHGYVHTGGNTRRLGGGEPIFIAPAGPRARTLI